MGSPLPYCQGLSSFSPCEIQMAQRMWPVSSKKMGSDVS